MNGKTRHDGVEGPKVRGQGDIQVVSDDADSWLLREAAAEPFERGPARRRYPPYSLPTCHKNRGVCYLAASFEDRGHHG